MKANVQIIYVDPNPSEFNQRKFYKHQFVDDDGLVGSFYSDNHLKFGDRVKVQLTLSDNKYKFKLIRE